MEFLITEKQLRTILSEGDTSGLSDSLKQMYKFTEDMVKRVLRTYGVNLRMFLTWGTSVGGLVLPLDNFIKNGNFDLNQDQRMLVLSGVCFLIFFEGKRGLSKILQKIEQEGLTEVYEEVLIKGLDLKVAFEGFLDGLKHTSGMLLEIVAYSFLIPIAVDIFEYSHNVIDIQQTAEIIVDRLLASGVVLIGREVLMSLIRKMLKKFKR